MYRPNPDVTPAPSVPEPAALPDRWRGIESPDHFPDVLPGQRMQEIGIQLLERVEHEGAPERLGVRELEVGLVELRIAEEEQVEVDRARAPALRANPAHALLDEEHVPEERPGVELGLEPCDRVEK